MAFKIADAYVEIHSKIAKNDFMRTAQRLTTFLPIVGALSSVAVGAASALFSLASSIGFSTLALAGAIPAAFGLGGALGVLMLIFKDMKKTAMKPILDDLIEIKTRFQEVAIAFAKPGIERFMRSLQGILPIIETHVRNLAFGFGFVADELARLSETELFRGRLEKVLNGSAIAMGDLFQAIEPIVDIIVTLGAAAVPVFQRFAHWIRVTVEHWQRWLSMKESTGELTDLFQRSADEFSKWAQIVYNFLSGLVGLMAAGKDEGGRLSESLLGISEAFKTWSWDPETQGKVKELLETINRIDYAEILQIATAITSFGIALRGIGVASTVVQGLLQLVATGGFVGIVFALAAIQLALYVSVLVAAYFASDEFKKIVDQTWTWINENVLPILKDLYHWLKEKLIDAIDTAIRDTMPKFEEEWRKIEKAWQDNKGEIIPLVDKIKELAEFMISRGIPAVIGLMGVLAPGLTQAFSTAAFMASGLNRVLDGAGTAIEIAENAFGRLARAVGDAASAIGREVGRINDFFRNIKIPSFPSNPFSGLLGRAHGGVVGAFAHGGISGAASGGARSGFSLVGEAGPELVRLGAGSRVRSNPDTRRLLGGAASGGPQINLYVQGSIRSDQDLKRMLRDEMMNMGFG